MLTKNKLIFIYLLFPTFLYAGGDFGFGILIPREDLFSENAGINFYLDIDGKSTWRVNPRLGVDFTYMINPSDGTYPGIEYRTNNYRLGIKLSPFKKDKQKTGIYFGGGLTYSNATLKVNEMTSGNSPNITYVGSGGLSDTWARLYNQMGSSSSYSIGGGSTNSSDTGWNIALGYEGNYWHCELMYEKVDSEILEIGGLYIRFGFDW